MHVKRNIFLSYIIILVLPVSILGIGGYRWSSKIVKQQTERSHLNILSQKKNAVETRLAEIDKLSVTLAESSWVQKLAYMAGDKIDYDRMNIYSLLEKSEELNNYKSLNTFINEVIIVFFKKSAVLTTRGVEKVKDYFTSSFQYENMDLGFWNNTLMEEHKGNFFYNCKLYYYYHEEPEDVILYIKTLPIIDTDEKVHMIVSIKNEAIQQLINVNDTNPIFIHDGDELITADNTDENTFSTLKVKELENNTIRYNGSKYFMFETISELNNWAYKTLVPFSQVLNDAKMVRNITIIFALSTLIIGIIFAYGLAVKNYKPLRNVVDLIRNVGSSYKANEDIYDEYSLIKTTFNTIVTHENQLEQKVNRYKPMAMYSILLKLFHGLVNYKDLEDIVDILSCDVTGYLWSAAVFHVHPIVEYKEIDVTIIKNENNLPLIAYIARIKDNRFAVLIGYRDNVKKDAFEIVKTTLSTKYSDNQIKIGIGMEYQDILLVHKSYIESLLAVENCMIKSRMHIMYYENINNASEINYFYPLEIENKIISNTIMGNYSIVETSINDLIAKNLENTVSVISARCQCYSLISTAFKVLTTAGVGTTNYIDENILISMDTLDDMTEYIKSVYKRICIEMVKVKESSNFDTRDKIIEYIERNYSDPTIYLSSVAEKFGFSESYLSRFIKDQTGIGFTSYLTQIRLAKAKELMKDEKYTMDCISLKVGYSNVLTFRRAFKKYEGITPGKYQRMINYV